MRRTTEKTVELVFWEDDAGGKDRSGGIKYVFLLTGPQRGKLFELLFCGSEDLNGVCRGLFPARAAMPTGMPSCGKTGSAARKLSEGSAAPEGRKKQDDSIIQYDGAGDNGYAAAAVFRVGRDDGNSPEAGRLTITCLFSGEEREKFLRMVGSSCWLLYHTCHWRFGDGSAGYAGFFSGLRKRDIHGVKLLHRGGTWSHEEF